jgi:mono/diheme cytochrome c family protein
MSNENPQLVSPPPPRPDASIQPDSPDFIETPETPPLSLDREPFPTWLYLVCGVALFLAGSSFTGVGNFSEGLLDQGPGGISETMGSKGAPAVVAAVTPMDLGKSLYGSNCANCHQGSGMGEPGSYPPLVASEWVMGSKERLAAIMLHGITGSITVKGDTFGTQVMPGWSGVFTDEKLADIMTYIRGTWGNTMDAVTPDEVTAARAKFASQADNPFTEAELMKIAPNGTDSPKK